MNKTETLYFKKKARDFMQLGDRLRNAREERDLKQTDVARQTGISNKVLSSYERNISLPTIDNLILLCNCYQISSDELLGIQLPTENSQSVLDISVIHTQE